MFGNQMYKCINMEVDFSKSNVLALDLKFLFIFGFNRYIRKKLIQNFYLCYVCSFTIFNYKLNKNIIINNSLSEYFPCEAIYDSTSLNKAKNMHVDLCLFFTFPVRHLGDVI